MSLTAEEIRECTMIALDQPPFWPEDSGNPYAFKFTIYVDGSAEQPLTYRGPSIYLSKGTINWGDGSEEEYEEIYYRSLNHTYSHSGEYQITVLSERTPYSFRSCNFNNDYSLISIDTPIPISSHSMEFIRIDDVRYTILYFMNEFSCRGCRNLESIPENFFKYVKNIWCKPILIDDYGEETPYSDISNSYRGPANYQFENCLSLVTIPKDLYKNTGVKSAISTFSGCSLLQCDINEIFENCIYLQSVYNCFGNCTSLTNLSGSIFHNCKSLRNLGYCFYNCIGLRGIPDGIFNDIGINDQISTGYSFIACFESCTGLTTIANELFSNLLSGITIDFSNCFEGCSALLSIPSDIFFGCQGAITFQYCFQGCILLDSIPELLFYDCSLVSNFAGCFKSCYNITYVPTSLFNRCTNVTIFTECFKYCSSITSNVPNLWETHPAATNYGGCFYACYNAQNYADIPLSWKR